MATQESVSWVTKNRATLLRYSIPVVILVALAIAAAVVYQQSSSAAETALGQAIDVYSAPLAQPGVPPTAGVYANAADRARAANKMFQQIVDKYKLLPQTSKAHYFLGLTDEDLGNNAAAESELKQAASAWDSNLSSLATFALAGLYHQTGRDAQAVTIYQQLATGKGTTSVPAFNAQLALADLYNAEGKKDQAKALWAKVKDADKDGAAGAIAAQRLPAQN